jgi:hypothetical protein
VHGGLPAAFIQSLALKQYFVEANNPGAARLPRNLDRRQRWHLRQVLEQRLRDYRKFFAARMGDIPVPPDWKILGDVLRREKPSS